MMAISRFRVAVGGADAFRSRADAVASFFASRTGCEGVDVVQNLDEPDLWAIVSRWADVGSYRRSFNGYDAKMALMPLLGEAIDEASAYAAPDEVGANLPRGV